MNRPDLSVVVVSWNVRELLCGCLRSLRETAGVLDVEVVVVDNASSDGSAEQVRTAFPQVQLIALDENTGYAGGNNRGLAASHGRHVLSLNPDTVVRPGALEAIVRTLDSDPHIGAVAPRNLREDGRVRPSARRFPSRAAMLYRYLFFRGIQPLRGAYRAYRMRDVAWDREMSVDQPAGAALAVRRTVLEEVGGWDDGFFMYFEEVDLCRRIRDRGYEIRFTPAAEVVHLGGRSTRQMGSARRLAFFRSMFRYFDKHGESARTRLFRVVFKAGYVVTAMLELPVSLVSAAAFALAGRPQKARRALGTLAQTAVFLTRDVWRFLAA